MSRRDNADHRCALCRMHDSLCICDLVTTTQTRTRLVLCVHREEERKPTNTGLLAARCLLHSSVIVVGDLARPLPERFFADDEQPLLLFPSDDARPLPDVAAQLAREGRRAALVVPDGTWRQAGKMGTRLQALRDAVAVPRVTLPAGAMTTYRLRAEPRAGGLATIEAIARALAILEDAHELGRGDVVSEALLAPFRAMVDRTLWLRGMLPATAVSGGLPAGATRDPHRASSTADT